MITHINSLGDVCCEHGTAMDVHCCNCHSGFMFDFHECENPMSRIPDFMESLKRMEEIHLKKNEDYAVPDNPFSNFDVSEYLLSLFKNDRDKAFVWPIATKLARLATLLNSNRPPNNESIDDSFIDCANYFLLWKADVKQRVKYIMRESEVCPKCASPLIGKPKGCPHCKYIVEPDARD